MTFPKSDTNKFKSDNISYNIQNTVIQDTEKILKEYGALPNEGLVYWGGTINNNIINITTVIAPHTESNWGRVSTSNKSNFEFVIKLNEKKIIQIAQIHSHPSSWVDHSDGDDKFAAFKIEGLLSIVVPDYCEYGMLPLTKCGVHRYEKGIFKRLTSSYIKSHFTLNGNMPSNLMDLRK